MSNKCLSVQGFCVYGWCRISNARWCLLHRVAAIVGDVLFSTKESSPYDLAVVQLRDSLSEASFPQMAQSFHPGFVTFLLNGDTRTTIIKSETCFMFSTKPEPFLHLENSCQISLRLVFFLSAGDPVVVVGYGGMGRRCGPSLTRGVLSKAISLEHQPVMLQTTCAVQAGTSGGAVVHRHTRELLGKKQKKNPALFVVSRGHTLHGAPHVGRKICWFMSVFSFCTAVFPVLTHTSIFLQASCPATRRTSLPKSCTRISTTASQWLFSRERCSTLSRQRTPVSSGCWTWQKRESEGFGGCKSLRAKCSRVTAIESKQCETDWTVKPALITMLLHHIVYFIEQSAVFSLNYIMQYIYNTLQKQAQIRRIKWNENHQFLRLRVMQPPKLVVPESRSKQGEIFKRAQCC